MRGSKDIVRDLITARERDLTPILREGIELLCLDEQQAETMDEFLCLAWLSGTKTGYSQLAARAEQGKVDVGPVRLEETEAEFRVLMEDSAEALNLSVAMTLRLWQLLAKAWMTGVGTGEAEITAQAIERRHDIPAEAQQWLSEAGRDGA